MVQRIEPTKDTVTFKIELHRDDYSLLRQRAEERHLTMKEYGTLRLLDDVAGTEELRREIIKMMPQFYNCINTIGNNELKDKLIRIGEALCRL